MQPKLSSISLLFIIPLLFSCTNKQNIPDLLVGRSDLNQTVSHHIVDTGVDFYNIIRGSSTDESFVLSSGVLTSSKLAQYQQWLTNKGIPFSVENSTEAAFKNNTFAKIIRIRGFTSKAEADTYRQKLASEGLIFNTQFSAQDGYPTNGPFQISLLKVDLNKFNGKIETVLAQDQMVGSETVSSMAARNKAIVGVNAGFFAWEDSVGDAGAPAGIYVKNGQLMREATNHRPVLIIDNSGQKSNITFGKSVTTDIYITKGNDKYQIDGINRKPGILLNCGGYRSQPTTEAAHDFVCHNENEIIVYDSNYGPKTPNVKATEMTINEQGKIVSIKKKGNSTILPGFKYIQFTGNRTLPLTINDDVSIIPIIKVDGVIKTLSPNISMVSAGPTLITNFKENASLRYSQGWNPYPKIRDFSGSQDDDGLSIIDPTDNREAFYEAWTLRRHPRTAIGITSNNIVYIAVVYGRSPTVTEGATITEMGLLMKSLGVKEAMNLDGGGSSIMVIEGQATGTSSDGAERLISDALLLVK